nr:Chain C, VP60-2 [Rabbit hemorrhagic disease virus]
ALMPGQFFV